MSGFHDASQGGLREVEADFVVVGSGAGGGAAARVLAQAGRSVVVLEEGPLVGKESLTPVLRHSLARMFREGGKMAAIGPAALPILQGRCVGGTTFVNSAIIWRLPEKILAQWHGQHGLGSGLPAAALDQAYGVLEEELYVRPVGAEIASGSDLLMALGAGRAQIDHRYIRRSEQACQGTGRCFHGCPHDAKQSTTINQLRRAADDGADVLSNAGVEQVLFDGDRAVAVRGRILGAGPDAGIRFRARARKAVVVSASAVQSPNLLARSGVRHAHLGAHFMAHPGTSVTAFYEQPVHMWSGASQGYEAYGLRDTLGVKFETINVPPEIAASRLPGAGQELAAGIERLPHLASWAVALRADAEGTVRPSWLFGDLIRYGLTAGDLDRLRKGLKALAGMHFLAGAKEVLPGVHGMPDTITSPDQLALFDQAPLDPRAYSLLATHLFGGCRAGSDAAGAVVDPQLKVHGKDALYVMDASVFPSNTGVNPQHAIMAVARVAAGRLA